MSNVQGAVAAALIAACQPALAFAPDTAVQTVSGRLTGTGSGVDGVTAYLGIPYAAAPVGPLRWQPPGKPPQWNGTRAATAFGPACPQAVVHDPNQNLPPIPQSEDCLSLNVWSPAAAPSARMPVIVEIVGGGFRNQSSAVPAYNLAHLAAAGAVTVNFNYRIGLLGFMAHPLLSAESPRHISGNYGMLDMVAALQWVHDNIAAFGGDPDRVTLMGESSASVAVNLLTASPLVKGLVGATINQSGNALGATAYMTSKPLSYGEAVGSRLMGTTGATTLAAMRALPVQALLAAQARPVGVNKSVRDGVGQLDPLIDGYFLPADVRDVFTAGHQLDVPMLMGVTTHEGVVQPPLSLAEYRDFVDRCYPRSVPLLMSLFPADTDAQAARSVIRMADILNGPWSIRDLARLAGQTGHHPVWFYIFDQAVQPARGAYHVSDVFTVLGTWAADVAQTPDDVLTTRLMQQYWVNFAARRDPNGAGLPPWPRYRQGSPYDPAAERGEWLRGSATAEGRLPDPILLDTLDAVKALQRATMAPAQRC